MTNSSSQTHDRAEAKFKKIQRAEDGAKARTEYEVEALAVRARTAQLRSLRLAREAAEVKVEIKKKPVTRSKKPSV